MIDGARFEVTGRSIPFSETKETVLDFQFRDLELARYLPYLPFEPRFKVNAGKLGSTLEVRFSQPDSGSAKLSVSGGLEIAGLDLRNSAGRACWPSGRWSWISKNSRHSSVALHCDRYASMNL